MEENSVDSIVTDPPYGWRFMGKAWDGADIEKRIKKPSETEWCENRKIGHKRCGLNTGSQHAGLYDLSPTGNQAFQHFSEEWAREALRVLKPGGHVLIFCGPRTYHRMACGVEDAGFEIRDQLQWLFGSGFPKSHNVSKGIDKAAGAKREVVGSFRTNDIRGSSVKGEYRPLSKNKPAMNYEVTAPATPEAKQWEGFGTALKPANEPILLARKPLSEKTVAANVLKWGTGGINIDGCRIGFQSDADKGKVLNPVTGEKGYQHTSGAMTGGIARMDVGNSKGRFPANLILDETAAAMLDEQSGDRKSGTIKQPPTIKDNFFKAKKPYITASHEDGNRTGASRFFYVAKASKREKGDGNSHPTVKPLTLMRHLCRLITPPGGIVLDPFMGSGSTGVAALAEGFEFIGIEREAEYLAIAKKRINK